MSVSLFLQGLIIGFSIAAPVGPIGILCIRRTLAEGRAAGFFSGMGAATADALYGCVAGFGLTVVSAFLIEQRFWLQVIGGIFLCYLGARTLRAQPATEAAPAGGNGLLASYVSTFFLTITNPMTILYFAALVAGLGLAATGADYSTAGILVSGVVAGSALWWLCLSAIVGVFRQKFNA
ncbi:MAG: LysE family transporter, partial [Desulfobacterales bacterium]|nr:LysE family transporter [Desulfobacterales bacterium]